MSFNDKYPYKKVVAGFTLCPCIVSVLFVVGFFVEVVPSALDGCDGIESSSVVLGGLGGALIFPIASMLFFGPPAFCLALFYALVKLKKSAWAYILVFLVGGSGAEVWAAWIWGGWQRGTFPLPWPFFMGGVSSLIMAFFILPKPATMDEGTSEE